MIQISTRKEKLTPRKVRYKNETVCLYKHFADIYIDSRVLIH